MNGMASAGYSTVCFVFSQFLQIFYNHLFVAVGRISPQSLIVVSITEQFGDFGGVVHCVERHSASSFVC